MTDRELMQMAFDAIEPWKHGMSTGSDMYKAMEALGARLAQPTPAPTDNGRYLTGYKAQPEPEPEPYCWTWDKWISGGYWEAQYGWEPYRGEKRPQHVTDAKPLYTAPPQRKENSEPVAWLDEEGFSWVPGELPDEHAKHCKPLYLAPPSKEWVGLTVEEHTQIAIACGCASADWLHYGLTVERKLKEKNA